MFKSSLVLNIYVYNDNREDMLWYIYQSYPISLQNMIYLERKKRKRNTIREQGDLFSIIRGVKQPR